MGRGLTSGLKASLATLGVQPAWFVHLGITPASYFWTGLGTTTQNDSGGTPRSWIGIGDGGLIEGIGSSDPLRSSDITIALAGIPGAQVPGGVIAQTRAVRYQGKQVDIYLSTISPTTGAPQHTPEIIWSGFADVMTMRLGSDVQCTLTAEHLTSILRRTAGFLMTTENHNTRLGNPSPRDLFYEPSTSIMGQPKPFLDPN